MDRPLNKFSHRDHDRDKDKKTDFAWQRYIGTCLLIVCPVLLAANSKVSNETLSSRRQTIAALSNSERQELIRKFESFKKLDESEKSRLRQLQADIELNSDFKQITVDYCDWLKQLSSVQKQRLHSASTPEHKRRIVEELRAEQWRTSQESSQFVQLVLKTELPLVASEDLKTIMTVLESDLLKSGVLNAEQQKELESHEGTFRYRALMKIIAEYRFPKGMARREFTFSEAVRNAIVNGIKDERLVAQLRGAERNQQRIPLVEILVMVLAKATIVEADRELQSPIAERLKADIFKSMKLESQEKYTQLEPDERDARLTEYYLKDVHLAFFEAGGFRPPVVPRIFGLFGHLFSNVPPSGNGQREPGFRPMLDPNDVFDRPPGNLTRPPFLVRPGREGEIRDREKKERSNRPAND